MVQLLKKHTELFDSTCDVQISARANLPLAVTRV